MSSSNQKGNNHSTLLIVTLFALLTVFGLIAELMLSNGLRSGKYKDPQIAEKVIPGSIYGSDSSLFAMETPSYDLCFELKKIKDMDAVCQTVALYTNYSPSYLSNLCRFTDKENVTVNTGLDSSKAASLSEDLKKCGEEESVSIVKNYVRNYPATFHCSTLIYQTEKIFKDQLYPRPGFNEGVTYGKDVNLTISIDVQYLLDIAVQNLVNSTSSDFKAMVLNYATGEVLAMTTTPFANPQDCNDSMELAFLDSITLADGTSIKPYFIADNNIESYKDIGFKYSNQIPQGSSYTARLPNRDNPKYLVIIGSDDNVDKELYTNAILMILNGLISQGKI